MNYPQVADEFETMRRVADGASLARFGDGELKMIYGSSYVRQEGSLKIATELFNVLNHPAPGCLVGIPTMDERGPKFANWQRHRERFENVIQRAGPFYSAFVTRPDSAPWIECGDYLELCLSVWRGKRVTLISEAGSKLRTVLARTARMVEWVECPSSGCYAVIKNLQGEVKRARGQLVVLSCGVTATALANRLTARGVHALDFGSVGGMLARLLEKETATC